MMADWGAWKPILTALALPPVPFLLMVLLGARLILPRRGLGYLILLTGVLGLWFSACHVTAVALQNQVLKPPPALYGLAQTRLSELGAAHAQQLRRTPKGSARPAPPAGIIVLGGGRQALAPEYGASDLSDRSMARLRYGIWLSRQTGLPVGFSGGVGWAQQGGDGGPAEAEVAARQAEQLFGVRLQWVESRSPDTRGNAAQALTLLGQDGVAEVVLVTDAFHMPRAQRAFIEAARQLSIAHADWPVIKVTPAPTGFWRRAERPVLDWLPSSEGSAEVRWALREWVGWWLGA
jgi:uncharacterized SAM-binding protein YcdF (DUF218 family)